ncbi:TonB-dependent receptor [Methyloceanibacter sp. wino2]|uniref:TonB-dependent receptor n=1 Tax=Methyloceanibacter sp. wino2 TaxID=2170729 RepID=UPI00131F3D63|nr:TonB-dependent receptor [Methyloceanibacter sp. wino2]
MGAAAAQEAGEVQEVYELPAIEITTASPVEKPKKASSGASGGASRAPSPARRSTRPASPSRPSTQTSSRSRAPAQPAPAQTDQVLDIDIPAGISIVSGADSFVPVTVATEREILANPGATITDSLQNKPGISGTTFAPGANRPIIRGLDSYRVRIQENGIGSHDVSAISEDHAIPIDPSDADKIEVVRGPSTLRYGSQAIGGVVSVENQRIPTYLPEHGFSGMIKGGGNTVDEGGDGAFSVTGGSHGIVLHADGFIRDYEDYETPLGEELNSFVDSKGGSAGISHVWDNGFIGVSYARFESLYGIPGEEAEEGFLPRIDLVQDKVLVKGEWRPESSGIEAVRFWFGASDYAHDELERHSAAGHDHEEEEHGHDEHEEHEHEDEEAGDFEIGSVFTNEQQEARMEIQHSPVMSRYGEVRGAVGVHWDHADTAGLSYEGDSLLEPADTESIAGFWFEELEASDRWRFQTALRVESASVDGFGYSSIADPEAPVVYRGDRTFVPVSGGLGALYDLGNNTVLRLNGQAVERAPAAAELFSKGAHHASNTFEIGNPFLNEEKAQTIELGLKRPVGKFRYDASGYYTNYDGFIYRELTGLTCGVDLDSCEPEGHDDHHEEGHEEEGHSHSFDQVLFKQRNAVFYGVELLGEYDVGSVWRGVWGIDGQYDFVHARFDDGEYVPRMPPHRLGGGVYYRDSNWFARVGLLHAFEQNQVAPEEPTTPGYTLLNAELSYVVASAGPGVLAPTMRIGVKGDNLLDEKVLNSASFKRRENVLEPGANVRFFGSMRF